MYTSTIAVALAAALPSAVSALGNTIIKNQCDYPVYAWSVSNENYDPPMITIDSGASWSQGYQTPASGGISLKIARTTNLWKSAITQFEYTVSDMLFYDISNINGFPFSHGGLNLIPSEDSCPAKTCSADTPNGQCPDAYNKSDDDWATAACSTSADTTMVLCTANSPSHPHSHAHAEEHAAPAPAPAPVKAAYVAPAPAAPVPVVTAAPAVTAEAIPEPNGHIWTTFVTQVVTVEAKRDAMPTQVAEPVKREDMHAQMHARSAHRHHFHRHEADAE